MIFDIVITLLLTLHASGLLKQTLGSKAVCEEDEAVFVCTNNIGAAVWEITVEETYSVVQFSFGTFFTNPFQRTFPGPSVITGNVTFVNSTYIMSMVTFSGAIFLNESIVDCDRQQITYITKPGYEYLPSQLSLQSITKSRFPFTSLYAQIITEEFILSYDISPSLIPNAHSNLSHLLINISSFIRYNIIVSMQKCPHFVNQTYIFDRCPYIIDTDLYSVVEYILGLVEIYYAVIRCTYNNFTFVTECDLSKHWNVSLSNICIVSTTHFTKSSMFANISLVDEEECPMCKHLVGTSVIALATGVVVCSVVLFLIDIGIGVSCGSIIRYIKVNKKNIFLKKALDVTTTASSKERPLYEELDLSNKLQSVRLSDNIAYGETNNCN